MSMSKKLKIPKKTNIVELFHLHNLRLFLRTR